MAFIEPCFGSGHNLSLICQMASEDIKHQLIIIQHTAMGLADTVDQTSMRTRHTIGQSTLGPIQTIDHTARGIPITIDQPALGLHVTIDRTALGLPNTIDQSAFGLHDILGQTAKPACCMAVQHSMPPQTGRMYSNKACAVFVIP